MLVAFGLYWLLMPQPILVETAEIVATTFQDTIEEDGRTRVRDRYLVSAPPIRANAENGAGGRRCR